MSVGPLTESSFPSTKITELQFGEVITDILVNSTDKLCFGIGGDFISEALPFFNEKLLLISSNNELNAGCSAIANSIFKKMPSIAITTWNVGSLSQLDSMKFAQENNVPVIFISGGLGTDDMKKGSAHHAVSSVRTSADDTMVSVNAAKSLGLRSVSLLPENSLMSKGGKKYFKDVKDLPEVIKKLSESIKYSIEKLKPIYIEIPRDLPVTWIPESLVPKELENYMKLGEMKIHLNDDDDKFLNLFGLSSSITESSNMGFSKEEKITSIDIKSKNIADLKSVKEIIVDNLKNLRLITDNHRAVGIDFLIASSLSSNDQIPVLFTTQDLFLRKGVDEIIKLGQTEKKSCILLFSSTSDNSVDYHTIAEGANCKSKKVTTYHELNDAIKKFNEDPDKKPLLIEVKMDEYPSMFVDKIEPISKERLKGTFSQQLLNLLSDTTCKVVFKGDHYKNPLLTSIFNSDSRFILKLSPNSMQAGYSAGVSGRRDNSLGIGLFDSVSGVNGIANAFAENYPMIVFHTYIDDKDKTISTAKALNMTTFDIDEKTPKPLDKINDAIKNAKEKSEPVYVEISKEVLLKPCANLSEEKELSSIDKEKLNKMADDLIDNIKKVPSNENIYIFLGEKFNINKTLVEQIKEFSELTNIPIACSLYAKSACPEDFKLSLGVFLGTFSRPETLKFFKEATFAIKLGEAKLQRDVGSGFGTMNKMEQNLKNFTFKGEYPDGKDMEIFLDLLISKIKTSPITKRDFDEKYKSSNSLFSKEDYEKFIKEPVTLRNYYKMMATHNNLNNIKDIVNIFDCGTAWFGSFSMYSPEKDSYLASNFYASMGFSIPALDALSEVQSDKFPILVTGDGAFQMTGFSSMLKQIKAKKRGVVIIFRNDKYAFGSNLESPINKTANKEASYAKIISGLGGRGIDNVRTFEELFYAVKEAKRSKELIVIEIRYNKEDVPRESWVVGTWMGMMKKDKNATAMWEKIESGEITDIPEK